MRIESLNEIAVLRHNIHINNRLRLEIMASLSRLFREFDVPITDELLEKLILAIPAELNGTNYDTLGQFGNEPVDSSYRPPMQPWEAPEPPEPSHPPMPPMPPEPPEPRSRRRRSPAKRRTGKP